MSQVVSLLLRSKFEFKVHIPLGHRFFFCVQLYIYTQGSQEFSTYVSLGYIS